MAMHEHDGALAAKPSAPFYGILFDSLPGAWTLTAMEEPEFFGDLNLDQVVESITAGREEYDLKPYFHHPLRRPESVEYRHEVFRDLEDDGLRDRVQSFARRLRDMRQHLGRVTKAWHEYQKKRWFLDAVQIYCDAVSVLTHDLEVASLSSEGLRGLRDYLTGYCESDTFTSLLGGMRELEEGLAEVRYTIHIRGNRVTVAAYDGQPDYSADVLAVFDRFKQHDAEDEQTAYASDAGVVEERVLDQVVRLYPRLFATLDRYCEDHADFVDATIATFDREVQFYLAYLDHVRKLAAANLPFCYPTVSGQTKSVFALRTFDLALADTLVEQDAVVVGNDFTLEDRERIFVVTGPNQGGKTTFARTFGQLHYLAALGGLVPGTAARLYLFDRLFTHFEKEEDVTNLMGKLEEDLVRIHKILNQATGDSIVIMNEIFTSTTLQDALFLGREVMAHLIDVDLLGVCVTFIDELASLSDTTVSMVSSVVPGDPARRTYKIERRPADGLAYAAALAEQYQLGYQGVRRRVES